jgi:hypothetical protein
VEKQQRRYSHNYHRADLVFGLARCPEKPVSYKEKQAENRNTADKALFFGQYRENKIRVARRQKPQVPLRSLLEALAEKPARADGNLRLARLVSEAMRIACRIEDCLDAPPLLSPKHEPGNRNNNDSRQ